MTDSSTKKERVKEQFGRTAAAYVTSESHAKGDDLALLIDWLSPAPDWKALDIATGGGHVAKALSPHVESVYATDLTKDMLNAARGHLDAIPLTNVHYIVADAEALPFLDESFDVVTCRIAPHHFPNPRRFLAESWRVLRSGGHLLLIDNVAPDDETLAEYMNEFERLRDDSHVWAPSVRVWTEWLKEIGFTVDQSRSRKKKHAFSTWTQRMVKTEAEAATVERYILSGSAEAKAYFAVTTEAGRLTALEVDEWMALCTKP